MTLIYFILILGITVFIHEFGHFLFAKKVGIYCYEFSLGMGPKLFSFKRKNDETTYSIRLFPIGGYVQMAGEEIELDKNIPEDKRFQSKKWIQKALVVIAGVTFNFILAIILLFIVGLSSGVTTTDPIVEEVYKDTPAYGIIEKNDKIISVNNHSTKNLDMLSLELSIIKNPNIKFEVIRDGKIKELNVKADKTEQGYKCGFSLKYDVDNGIIPSIKFAFTKFASLFNQILRVVKYLFTGDLGLNTLSGPVGIYKVVGQTSQAGFINLIYLLAYISINVGVVNLLPIPAFDGGRLFFMIIEKITGNPLNPKVENTIHYIGLLIIFGLMIIVTYQDILRLIGG